MHLLFCTGRMLLFGKVILAKTFVAIRAAAQGFLIAFMAATRRFNNLVMRSKLFGIVHKKDPLSIRRSEMCPAIYTLEELSMDHYSK